MKINISYISEEAQQVSAIMNFLWHFLPETKTRKSDRHPPFKHIYLTTKKAGKPCDSTEST